MKKYKLVFEIVLLLCLAGISLLAIAPKTFVMPTSAQMMLLAVVLVLLAAFLVFLWREQPRDERELENQAVASRTAYSAGSAVLIVAMLVQSLEHHLDSAVPLALLIMIVTKVLVQRRRDA